MVCGWTIDTCGCAGGTCWKDLAPDTRLRAAAYATGFMWAATGRRYGLCEITVLPCNPSPTPRLYQTFPRVGGGAGYDPFALGAGSEDAPAGPVLISGTWFNRCGGGCTCNSGCGVLLDGPVYSISAVHIDGVEVDPATYEVHDRALLMRLDGCWPVCQVYGVEVPGFQVTYLRGNRIPDNVQYAAEALACEYAKFCTGAACGLPPRIVSLSRQGVDVTVAEVATTEGTKLRTGIAAVDDVIAAVNPHGRTQPGRVFSPDLPLERVVTWRAGS
jgi:hypothetical protein